jgi:hypothetical protein
MAGLLNAHATMLAILRPATILARQFLFDVRTTPA